MSYGMTRYDVVEVLSDHPAFGVLRHGDRIKGVLATPRLISEGTRAPVEAYRQSEYRPEVYPGGVWRIRDDSYDPPGAEYHRVVIEVVDPDNDPDPDEREALQQLEGRL